MVNGERSDSLLTDAVVSGSKRRSQSGSAEPKKDGEVADRTVPLEQVWGQGLPSHTLCCHFLNFVLLIAQLPPNFLGSRDHMCMKSSRLVAIMGAMSRVLQSSFPSMRSISHILGESPCSAGVFSL